MMKKAEDWGHVASSPARTVKGLPDDSQVHERFLMPYEYMLLLSRAPLNSSEPWTLPNERFEDLREFIMLGCNTGLRVSEALTLEFADVDWDRQVLRVRNKPHLNFQVKNYQERHIRLNSHAYKALQSLLVERHEQSDFVFHRKDGGRGTAVHDSFKALVRRCDLQADPPFNITAHLRLVAGDTWGSVGAIRKLMGQNSNHHDGKIRTPERGKPEHRGAADREALPKSLPSGINLAQIEMPQVPVTSTHDWCGGRESNPHVPCGTRDFKSLASTSSATPAR